jgi:hypothetical protein
LKTLALVSPDREARRRAREVLKRGLGPDSRVIVYDKLSEFVAVKNPLWGLARDKKKAMSLVAF